MMRARMFILTLATLMVAGGAYAHKTNPYLQYTMKVVNADVTLVAVPAKKPDPADVTDGQILTAIVRTRTAVSQLQLAIDRREGELLPPGIDEIADPAKKKEMLDLYVVYMKKVQKMLVDAEELLVPQVNKKPEERDFRAVKAILTDLESNILEAHKIFRPESG